MQKERSPCNEALRNALLPLNFCLKKKKEKKKRAELVSKNTPTYRPCIKTHKKNETEMNGFFVYKRIEQTEKP